MVPAYLEAAVRHPDVDQPQGRPQEPAGAEGAALLGRKRQVRRPANRDRGRPRARARRGVEDRAGVGRGQFLPGPGRAFAADGALLLRDPASSLRLSDVSMRDIYLQPDHREARRSSGFDRPRRASIPVKQEPFRIPSDLEYYGCGALQLLYYVGYGWLGLWTAGHGTRRGPSRRSTARPNSICASVAFVSAAFVGLNAIPIAAKWLLIGRWKEEVFPIWSLRYFRFWVVKTLVQSAPMALFVGNPLYNVYLRLLGAKIGRNVVIQSRARAGLHRSDLDRRQHDPAEGFARCSATGRARTTSIPARSRIGSDAFVGEASVLDIDTVMEDGTQLGHASSLQSGQRVPHGKHYHGSPAQETTADYCTVESKACTPLRRYALSTWLSWPRVSPSSCRRRSCCRTYLVPYALPTHLRVRCSMPTLRARRWLRSCLDLLLVSLALFFGAADRSACCGRLIVPRLLQSLPAARTGPTRSTACTTRLPGHRRDQQFAPSTTCCSATAPYIVHYLRLARLRPEQDRADRLEFRHSTRSTTIRSCATSAAAPWSRTGCR